MSTPYQGWGKPATGGTALRLAAIQSPNFVNGVSGWIIRQDGSAQFNSIVIPPGTSGNTVFVQGTTPTANAVNDLWVDTASGNAIFTWNGSAWVAEQFGSSAIASGAITTGLLAANAVTAAKIAANTITASQLAAGIVYAGIVDGTTITGSVLLINNSHGARILSINKSTGTWLLYADTGSAVQGGLIASCAATSGTDEFGNAYKADITAYGTGGSASYVQMLPGNPAKLIIATGDGTETTPGDVDTVIAGSAGTRQIAMRIVGPVGSGGAGDLATIQLLTRSADGTTFPPSLTFSISDVANNQAQVQLTPTSMLLTSTASAIQVQERSMGGTLPVIQTDTSITGPVTGTSLASITRAWSIPAKDAQAGTCYRLKAGGFGVQGSTAETLHPQITFMGVNIGSDTLAATFAASTSFEWTFEADIFVVTTGATGTARAHGTFHWYQVGGPTELTAIIGAHSTTDVTVNTTIAQTLQLQVLWGGAPVTPPSITGLWSTLERMGP